MAVVRVIEERSTITNPREIAVYLKGCNIDYEQWQTAYPIEDDTPSEEILDAFSVKIQELKARNGYVTADVIDVRPDTPGLDAMLTKFNREHWHDEDEVRFTISGHGLFHISPKAGSVVAICVEAGDLIRLPKGTWHWFNLCADRRIRAIRLFQNATGWKPYYTDSGVDQGFVPTCFGPSHLPLAASEL